MSMLHLIHVEMRRALHRRLVRWMIVVALVGCIACGVIAFASSADAVKLAQSGGHPALMRNWWGAVDGDDFLTVSALFLAVGSAICGASVAGAEWRAGTIATVLTWQSSRGRLHTARTISAALLAFTIGFALQVAFLASTLPAVWAHGTTAGTDGGWWLALLWAMLRISFITALLAVLALSVATIGRNTAAALVALAVWALVLEGLIRGLKPGLARFLVGENVATVVPWAAMRDVEFHRSPGLALATLVLYLAIVVAAATLLFCRRDISSA
jgi:hypothetical protein